MNRVDKLKLLQEAFRGNFQPLRDFEAEIERELTQKKLRNLSDEALELRYEYLRQKEYQETGILPPPMPDYSAMSDEELRLELESLGDL